MAEYLSPQHLAQIFYLAGQGCSVAEILEETELNSPQAIVAVCKQHFIELSALPNGGRVIPVRIGMKAADALRQKAGERGIVGVSKHIKLAQLLLEQIGREPGLVDAINPVPKDMRQAP